MGSLKLGTAFGIGIFVHWTFVMLPLYLLLSGGASGSAASIAIMFGLVAAVFGCVVLHELGHALMARQFGIQTRDITLYPIGGVARLERMSEKPWEEFWIAVAGPAVNVVIAAVLAFGLFGIPSASDGVTLTQEFAFNLFVASVVLILFNLLPAFPMDGGRVLRAALTPWLGRLRATEIAANVAAVIAGIMLFLGIYWWQIFLILGAVFVFVAGRAELAGVRWKERTSATDARQAWQVDVGAWAQQPQPATPGFTGFAWDERSRMWILWQNGRAVKAVTTE